MLEQQGGKEQHGSSFLRSSRKEQRCGGVAEMRRKERTQLKRAVACATENAARLDLVIVKVFSNHKDSVDLAHL